MKTRFGSGHIYAIKAVGTPYVKIGSTRTSVEERLRALQTGQPMPLEIVASVGLLIGEDARQIEHIIHGFLDHTNHRGEWFETTMDLIRLDQLVHLARMWLYFQEEYRSWDTLLNAEKKHALEDLRDKEAHLAAVVLGKGMSIYGEEWPESARLECIALDGTEQSIRKTETLFEKNDYLQVIMYWTGRAQHSMAMMETYRKLGSRCREMAEGYRDHATKRYAVQLELPWEDSGSGESQ